VVKYGQEMYEKERLNKMKEVWILMYSEEDNWGRVADPEIHGVVATLEQAVDWRSQGYAYYTHKTKLIEEGKK